MSYSSFSYLLIFLSAVFLIYTIMPKKAKWSVLLAASYLFLIINSGKLFVFLLISTVSVYFAGLLIGACSKRFIIKKEGLEKDGRKALKAKIQARKRMVVAAVLTLNFGLLIILKYWNFLCGTADGLVSVFGSSLSAVYPVKKLFMPLGISFYTLQAASYVIDVYRGKYEPSGNPFKVALFLSFFPQITEGPIGRFDLIGDQLYEGHSFDFQRDKASLQLIAWGLLKKVVIADRANVLVKAVFDDSGSYSGIVVLITMLVYTLQLYADFSGCMDIVRGSAGLFGVTLQENFSRPFFSQSVNEFWRRWHITLGAWLRDYVFYSVSFSKVFMKLSKSARKHTNAFFAGIIPASFALFFVWFGNGLWHGSGIKYITYGLYYYVIMMLGMLFEPLFKKFYGKTGIKRDSKVMVGLRIFRTFILVNIGMLMFRSDTLKEFFGMLFSVFGGTWFSAISDGTLLSLGLDGKDFSVLVVGTALIFIISLLQEKGHSLRREIDLLPLPVRWLIWLALLLALIVFGAYGTNYGVVDFVYGQF